MQITTVVTPLVAVFYCNRLSPKCKSQHADDDKVFGYHCNRLSPKYKSQHIRRYIMRHRIVTDYRLNANHNKTGKEVMIK